MRLGLLIALRGIIVREDLEPLPAATPQFDGPDALTCKAKLYQESLFDFAVRPVGLTPPSWPITHASIPQRAHHHASKRANTTSDPLRTEMSADWCTMWRKNELRDPVMLHY
jgi:hypothetical protein